ncbi:hypothetical protein [Thermomonospora cellulosilytica]|uniref:Uncharacterized protein n=1 Tax=Thermomonospora cellulosilytica TaxID=1411118 RepID=A0A7W3N1F1_9ACTN|nr:hypothetical protein [Thermomonospora cellulosilytica]MBA9005742.1 hypothetical protein [Thermomonospora cellulosilytica]
MLTTETTTDNESVPALHPQGYDEATSTGPVERQGSRWRYAPTTER